jgi:TetR/AcrR family transcriptional repressor of lmrAB and yxaGH operons
MERSCLEGMAPGAVGMRVLETMKRGDVRSRMVEAAVSLLATRGLEGTSFADVLAVTGGPRGSVYHHFPQGKAELVHAALDLASARGLAALEASRGQPPVAVVAGYLDLWRGLLDRSQLTAGCAVLAVTVAASDAELLSHAGAIFRTWTAHLAELLTVGGLEAARANQLATLLVTTVEGAVAVSRAEGSREPFDSVAETLLRLAEG